MIKNDFKTIYSDLEQQHRRSIMDLENNQQ